MTKKKEEVKAHEFTIINYKNQDIQIDNKLIQLIKQLWKLNIETSGSCQNHFQEGKGYIAFNSLEDFNRFFSILATYSQTLNIDFLKLYFEELIYESLMWVCSFNENDDGTITPIYQPEFYFPEDRIDELAIIFTEYNNFRMKNL